ncbi:MAG: sulfatase-like hydrolase/transferase [Opitutales bacterium]
MNRITLTCACFVVHTLNAELVIDFSPSGNIQPNNSKYTTQISNLNSPSASTTDGSGDIPGLTGSFRDGDSGDGAFSIIIEGRNDVSSDWDGDTWTGGTLHPVNGNSSGLGISDGGVGRVEGGEAILWTFDLSSLNLDPNEELSIRALSLDNSSAQLWRLVGTPGNPGAGERINTGEFWDGNITISDGDQFALAGQGRLDTMTLEIAFLGAAETPQNLSAIAGVSTVSLDWNDDSNNAAESYTIYRSTSSPASSDDAIGTSLTSDYIDDTPENGVTYYYAVSALSTNGETSALSAEVDATPQQPSPIQELNADEAPDGLVAQWPDSSLSGNNAADYTGSGSVFYYSDSAFTFPSGKAGVDFGSSANSLRLFRPSNSDAWLNQSGGTDGFSIFLTIKSDQIVPGVLNDILGNSTDGSNGLQISLTDQGSIRARVADTSIESPTYRNIEAGDSIVIALRYDAVSETLELWESKNYEVVSASIAKRDFSTSNRVTLGSIDEASQFLSGIVGEVRIYDSALDSELFTEIREELLYTWNAPPNIVMILVDDWAWNGSPVLMDDRMLNSGVPEIVSMPTLNRMASEGMIFRNAFSSPQCGPARASLQTGTTGARNRFTVVGGPSDGYFRFDSHGYPVLANVSTGSLRPQFTTIPEALEPLGYRSAHLGKWHAGGDPGEEGYLLHDGNTSNSPGQTVTRDENGDRDLSVIVDPKLMNHITTGAMDFMEAQHNSGNPFYVQLSHYAVHNGQECFEDTWRMFQDYLEETYDYYNREGIDKDTIGYRRDPASWLANFYELDGHIASVYNKLDELGIRDNTYVVVMSDNGFNHGFFQDIRPEYQQPLHMRKWWVWQGGIRVPMFATGPGISPGSLSTANVAIYDLLPTFLDWAGGDPGRLIDIDGISLKSLMKGEEQPDSFINRSLYFHYPHYRSSLPHSCVIQGNDKLMYFYEAPLLHPESPPQMLFDLSSDPGEYENIYAQNPTRGDELYEDLMSYMRSVEARIPILNTQEAWDNHDSSHTSETIGDLPADWEFYNPDLYAAAGDGNKLEQSQNDAFFVGTRADDFNTFTDYWLESWGINIGGLHEDFDGDSITNLEEYAFGWDPTVANASIAPLTTPDSSDPFALNFNIRTDDSNILYEVQTSPDLETWSANSNFTAEYTTTFGTPIEQQTIRLDDTLDALFLRLQISTQN